MTTTMSILIQREAFSYFSLSNASTMSVIAFVIMLTIIIVFKSIARKLRRNND